MKRKYAITADIKNPIFSFEKRKNMGNSMLGRFQGHHPTASEYIQDYHDALSKHRFLKYRWTVMYYPSGNQYSIFSTLKNYDINSLKESNDLVKDDRRLSQTSFQGDLHGPLFKEWFENYEHLRQDLHYRKMQTMNVTCTRPDRADGRPDGRADNNDDLSHEREKPVAPPQLVRCKKVVYQTRQENPL